MCVCDSTMTADEQTDRPRHMAHSTPTTLFLLYIPPYKYISIPVEHIYGT